MNCNANANFSVPNKPSLSKLLKMLLCIIQVSQHRMWTKSVGHDGLQKSDWICLLLSQQRGKSNPSFKDLRDVP